MTRLNLNRKKLADIAERAAWTAAQGALGVVTADALGIPEAYALLFMTALSVAKSYVATQLGNGTAATLPTGLENTP